MVLANSDGNADMAKLVEQIRAMIAATKMPDGTFVSLEGTFQAQEQAARTIGCLSLVSLLLIFAILYSRYRSSVLALIIIGSVPLALIGSVAALWLVGQPLSVASMIGFITLTGIAARNGILKISHIINLHLHEGLPWGRELVTRGCLERMTPVLMTALSAGVALVPLLIDAASPGQGNPASGRGHDFRRADQRDAARCVRDAAAGAGFRPQRGRAAARCGNGRDRERRTRRHHPRNPIKRGRPTMKWTILAVFAALAIGVPGAAHAQHKHGHGQVEKGKHGGQMVEAGDYHVELVTNDGIVDVYVSDHDDKPVAIAGYKGIAILSVGGKSLRIVLEADDDRLSGKAAVRYRRSQRVSCRSPRPAARRCRRSSEAHSASGRLPYDGAGVPGTSDTCVWVMNHGAPTASRINVAVTRTGRSKCEPSLWMPMVRAITAPIAISRSARR